VREKITGKLITLDETLRSTLPAVFALLDVAIDDPLWQMLDPSARRDRTLDAVKSRRACWLLLGRPGNAMRRNRIVILERSKTDARA